MRDSTTASSCFRAGVIYCAAAMSLSLATSRAAIAEPDTNVLPPGYFFESFQGDWQGNGSDPTKACAALVRGKYGNRPWQMVSSGEDHRWENDLLHIGSEYRYHCQALITPAKQ